MGLTGGGMDRKRLDANWARLMKVSYAPVRHEGRTHHGDDFGVDVLGDDTPLRRDPLEELGERSRLDLLPSNIGRGVVEVKHDCALVQLLKEELVAFVHRNLCATPQGISSVCPLPAKANAPMKPGNRSSSTLSVTWNLELRCFLGVLAIGIVSLGPPPAWRGLLIGPAVGGVLPVEVRPWIGGGELEPVGKGTGAERGETAWCGFEEGWGRGS